MFPPLDPANPLYCKLTWYIDTTYVSGKLGPGGEHTSKLKMVMTLFLAHLSRRLVGELIVYPWSGVRPSSVVRRPSSSSSSTISNMYISAASWPITTKFYLKHHWVGGKAALGFGPDRIRILVSMATESSHRVIMEKRVSPLFLGCFSSDPFHTCRQ